MWIINICIKNWGILPKKDDNDAVSGDKVIHNLWISRE